MSCINTSRLYISEYAMTLNREMVNDKALRRQSGVCDSMNQERNDVYDNSDNERQHGTYKTKTNGGENEQGRRQGCSSEPDWRVRKYPQHLKLRKRGEATIPRLLVVASVVSVMHVVCDKCAMSCARALKLCFHRGLPVPCVVRSG
jgi:hypothetical protein